MSFGSNLKDYRKAWGMTQAELGRKLNVSQQTIGSWEKDRTEPSHELQGKIADLFYEGIIFKYAEDLSDNLIGIFLNVYNRKIIILNGNLKYKMERYFYMAHELFHALYHHETVALYHNVTSENWKNEREANEFATNLLIAEQQVSEDMTTYEILKENYIPKEMERFLGGN